MENWKVLLIVGLLIQAIPYILKNHFSANDHIADFILGLGISLILGGLFLFFKNKMLREQKPK